MTKLERVRKLVRHCGPNTSTALGIVALGEKEPFKAYWPMRFTQLFGGTGWSISLCIFRTEKPLLVEKIPPVVWIAANEPRQ